MNVQQTPNPAAQFPSIEPPLLEHSDAFSRVGRKAFIFFLFLHAQIQKSFSEKTFFDNIEKKKLKVRSTFKKSENKRLGDSFRLTFFKTCFRFPF